MTLTPRAVSAAFDLFACLSRRMVDPTAQSEARLNVAADEMRAALDAPGSTPLARLRTHLARAGEEMVSIATTIQADAARADLLPFAAGALKSVIDAQEAVRALAAATNKIATTDRCVAEMQRDPEGVAIMVSEHTGAPRWGIVCVGHGADTWASPRGGEASEPDPYYFSAPRAVFDSRESAEQAAVRHTAASGAEGFTYRAALIVDVCVRCRSTRPVVGGAYCAPCRTATDEPAARDLEVVEQYAAARRGA